MKTLRRKLVALLPVLALGIVLPCSAHGQSAREAVLALKKLKTRCETALSYDSYLVLLTDTKLTVKRFLEGREATRNRILALGLEGILEIYEEARLTWSLKFRKSEGESGRFHRGGMLTLSDEQDRAVWSAFLAAYPAANKELGAGGAIVGGKAASIDAMVRMIWNRAALELAEVEGSLPGTGRKAKSED